MNQIPTEKPIIPRNRLCCAQQCAKREEALGKKHTNRARHCGFGSRCPLRCMHVSIILSLFFSLLSASERASQQVVRENAERQVLAREEIGRRFGIFDARSMHVVQDTDLSLARARVWRVARRAMIYGEPNCAARENGCNVYL